MNDTSKITNGTSGKKPGDLANGAASSDAGRTVLVGMLGGIVSAAAYVVYQRLPDEQKERLHRQVRGQLESRLNEIRSNFNI